jgi:hypothetical protein
VSADDDDDVPDIDRFEFRKRALEYHLGAIARLSGGVVNQAVLRREPAEVSQSFRFDRSEITVVVRVEQPSRRPRRE